MNRQELGNDSVRPDAADKVSGRAMYAADYSMENMLHVALVRSERAHARICGIDAAGLPENVKVFTAEDLADNVIVDIVNDTPALAAEKVRYMGEPVAVVAAGSREEAKKAARLVKVCYEDLPVCLDMDSALAPDAAAIHEGGNLAGTFESTKGDVEKGFAQADLVIGHTFFTPYQEHGYMEPDAGFSWWEGEKLMILSSSQNVFHDQRMIAHALGLPLEKVHVKAATVGGAFGGKDGHMTQIFGALVTQKTGRPAKIVFDREESIAYTYKRHSTEMLVRIGFRKDGTITAFEAENRIDTGAYIGYGYAVLGLMSEHIPGPYKTENIHVRSVLIHTNKCNASAFRGFGAPQGNFATESIISEAALALGLDPVEIRLRNALEQGDTGALGQKIDHSCGMKEALRMLEATPLWQSRKKNADPTVGYGLAAGHLSCGFGKGVPDAAEVVLQKEADEKYHVYMGFAEIGQGAIESQRAIAAEGLGVPEEQIVMHMADTAVSFDCGSTAASRSTFIGGNVILQAIGEWKARKQDGEEDPVVRTRVTFPETEMMHSIGAPHVMYTFVAQAVKVRVDPVTGCVRLLDAAAITEAGRVINPMQLSGQICGGMVQSLGFTLSEDIAYDEEGHLLNNTFSTYLLPTMLDIPHIETAFVDAFEPSGPFGAKGAAESPTVPSAAAVNAAIHNAGGGWHYRLPITPEAVLMNLAQKEGDPE